MLRKGKIGEPIQVRQALVAYIFEPANDGLRFHLKHPDSGLCVLDHLATFHEIMPGIIPRRQVTQVKGQEKKGKKAKVDGF